MVASTALQFQTGSPDGEVSLTGEVFRVAQKAYLHLVKGVGLDTQTAFFWILAVVVLRGLQSRSARQQPCNETAAVIRTLNYHGQGNRWLEDLCVALETSELTPHNFAELARIVDSLSLSAISDPFTLGWLHQFWNNQQRFQATVAIPRAGDAELDSEQISRITQIYTDQYIVQFLLENSFVKLWADDRFDFVEWRYLLTPADPAKERKRLARELSFLDPACGSGHFLVYAFRLFFQMLQHDEPGAEVENTVILILSNMLFGVDVDTSAVEISRISLWLEIQRHCNVSGGRIWSLLEDCVVVAQNVGGSLCRDVIQMSPAVQRVLTRSYSCVATNPPYLGRRKLPVQLRSFLAAEFPYAKHDLFAAFIARCVELTENNGMVALVTMDKWLRLAGYRLLREGSGTFKGVLNLCEIELLCDLGSRAFARSSSLHDGVRVVLSCMRKIEPAPHHEIALIDLRKAHGAEAKALELRRQASTQHLPFRAIPQALLKGGAKARDSWVHPPELRTVLGDLARLESTADVVVGLQTSNDEEWVRYNWEVPDASDGWIPYLKGGGYSRWSGMNWFMLDLEGGRTTFEKSPNAGLSVERHFARPGFCYSWFADGCLGLREKPAGVGFGRAAASGVFTDDVRLVAVLNARISSYLVRCMGGKIQLPEGVVRQLPVPSSLDAIDLALVETALHAKQRLSATDLREYTFSPTTNWDPRAAWKDELTVLDAEGLIDRQVQAAFGIPDSVMVHVTSEMDVPVAWYGVARGNACDSNDLADGCAAALIGKRLRNRTPAARGALPAIGIIERISRALCVHPASVYQIFVEWFLKKDQRIAPLLKDRLQDLLTVVLLEHFEHRWPQDKREVHDRCEGSSAGAILGFRRAAEIFQHAISNDLRFNQLLGEFEPEVVLGGSVEHWLRYSFFGRHIKQYKRRPPVLAVDLLKDAEGRAETILLYTPTLSSVLFESTIESLFPCGVGTSNQDRTDALRAEFDKLGDRPGDGVRRAIAVFQGTGMLGKVV